MDYDDINKIAELLTDDVKSNNGLANNISMHEPGPPDDLLRIARQSSNFPKQKRATKSVTLLERVGRRVVHAKQKELHNYYAQPIEPVAPSPSPAPVAPTPAPKINPVTALSRGARVLEL